MPDDWDTRPEDFVFGWGFSWAGLANELTMPPTLPHSINSFFRLVGMLHPFRFKSNDGV